VDAVSVVWDVHTLPAAGPVRHYRAYPDEDLVAEPVDDVAWADRLLGRKPGGTETVR